MSSPSRPTPAERPSWDPIALVRLGLRTVGAATVAVSGVSMLPTLRAGQRVVLRPPEPDAIQPGDVVAFQSRDATLVLHRVRAVAADMLITAGDNETLLDPPVPRHHVVGVLPDPPPAPDPARWTPAPAGPGPVDVWVVADPAAADGTVALPPGWRMHRRRVVGVGVSDGTLAELRSAVRNRPCVAVTEHAVYGAADLLPHPLPSGTIVLVGCSLGRLAEPMRGNLVPPDFAHVHVRVGPPAVPLEPSETLARLAAVAGGPS